MVGDISLKKYIKLDKTNPLFHSIHLQVIIDYNEMSLCIS